MLKINDSLTTNDLAAKAERLFEVSGQKILSIEKSWDNNRGTPVFTVKGRYDTRGWTEWTQGFRFGSAFLQYDATDDEIFFKLGMKGTLRNMAEHVSHTGVHDHGFTCVSTYGNLLRLIREKKIEHLKDGIDEACLLALKASGAVQAARWTPLPDHLGYIYSFCGPQSLFVDTMRSLRSLGLAHVLGHVLMGEQEKKISLLARLLQHAETTARYNVYWGENRDRYDIRGRVAHESIFNAISGSYRCPQTQQGYSPYSTWTRGLSWVLLGAAEQLEFLKVLPAAEFKCLPELYDGDKHKWLKRLEDTVEATAEFYIEHTTTDGIPFWDTAAPGLVYLPDWSRRPSDPYNEFEPVDSSAAAIAAQGLLRFGNYLREKGEDDRGDRYIQAALTVADTLFSEPYLSTDVNHQGILLHSIYHRPNGWDYIPPGQKIPCGESTMWGDYHGRELALMILRAARQQPYYTFFSNS
jgi:unsaturated chondroitin disaccharide hydrolase